MTEQCRDFWKSLLSKRINLKGELDHLKGKYIVLMDSIPKDERQDMQHQIAEIEAMDESLWKHANSKLDEE